ncbi:MAG: hypothetical protein A2X64_02790 [Ignavibacteria bacterium GWF2_33_9]|nr:MAG: hypothetical protein A2X64_02790 [Ignavibacteria bacterium GWF2_33_9]
MAQNISKKISPYIGNDKILSEFLKKTSELNSGKSSVIIINGSKGMGKTRILNEMNSRAEQDNLVKVMCPVNQPTGNIALVDLAPFSTFGEIILNLRRNKKAAKIQLFQSISLTVLASLPIAGDFFYAGKEISKDLKEYKENLDTNKANQNFIDILSNISKKKNLVIFIDNFHFADTHSAELLGSIIKNLDKFNILFVITVDKSSHVRQLFNFKLIEYIKSQDVTYLELQKFNSDEIINAINDYFPDEPINQGIHAWFTSKTHGNPLAVYKYLEYFKSNNLPLANVTNHELESSIPSELTGLFLSNIMKLSESDRNLLSHCALIGYEFPLTLIAELMKTDLLTIIKQLRSIQNATGIIQSIGVRTTFGEKVTHYQFSQPLYAEQFINQLEYEEKKEIKIIITNLYKKLYDNTDNLDVKNQIMPYLLSNAQDTENNELIQNIMQTHHDEAVKNHSEITKDALKNFMENMRSTFNLELENEAGEGEGLSYIDQDSDDLVMDPFAFSGTSDVDSTLNFAETAETVFQSGPSLTWEELVELSLNPISEDTIKKIEHFCSITTSNNEKLKANLLLAKIFSATERYEKASRILSAMNYQVDRDTPNPIDILFLNTKAILEFRNNNINEAIKILQNEAAPLSLRLGPEYKLLTLSNIALVLREVDLKESNRYKDIVLKQAKVLKFEDFLQDFQKQLSIID